MLNPMKLSSLLTAVAVLACAMPAQTSRPQQKRAKRPTSRATLKKAHRAARDFRRLQLPGEQVAANVGRLKQLKWHGSLGSGLQAAKSSSKPFLWIQALGDMDGFL